MYIFSNIFTKMRGYSRYSTYMLMNFITCSGHFTLC